MVLTILKNISQWEGLSHISWKIENVWNHQPARHSRQVQTGALYYWWIIKKVKALTSIVTCTLKLIIANRSKSTWVHTNVPQKKQFRSCMKLWILHIYVNWKVYERLEHREPPCPISPLSFPGTETAGSLEDLKAHLQRETIRPKKISLGYNWYNRTWGGINLVLIWNNQT